MKKKYYQSILIVLGIVSVFLPVNAHADNKYGIVIDGAFNDWSGLPITKLFFSYENGQNIKYSSLVTDESQLYFYLSMAPEGHNYHNLQPSGHKLKIGNKVFWMTFNQTFSSEDLSVIGQTKDVQVNFWAEDNSVNVTIPGKLTRTKTAFSDTSYSDEVEVAIPFDQLQVEETSSQTITYSNSNLGEQTITVAGGDTGPWILAGIAVVIASYSLWKVRGKTSKANAK
ncbi:firmicu-CTERM domain-containing protein [Enterococcus sp. 10A9_DIV0425]|uniref:Firmicu-CTERM domain-containing protein n=1 Tax=Candidatus Enterococcus wittei TaxID=1987383 RepID=A0A242JZ13_9ENTE|nr:Firmicu-CTERM sorting domain-containing protein [Enterococcus sp. 10A9_DIV0425]OTP10472.1 firmicu-CTERM domain-containing protein [Enterococcus sp. 10A9_DIV0425]